jgi:hypothetical protein
MPGSAKAKTVEVTLLLTCHAQQAIQQLRLFLQRFG